MDLAVTHPGIQEMADEAEAFVARWFRRNMAGTLLVVAGDSGTGKTHMANRLHAFTRGAAILSWEQGHWGSICPKQSFVRWPSAMAETGNDPNPPIIDECQESELLYLDDVGAENDPWKLNTERLCRILSRREFKHTLITTNIPESGWQERWDIRVADRLLRNSVVVDLYRAGVPRYSTLI